MKRRKPSKYCPKSCTCDCPYTNVAIISCLILNANPKFIAHRDKKWEAENARLFKKQQRETAAHLGLIASYKPH